MKSESCILSRACVPWAALSPQHQVWKAMRDHSVEVCGVRAVCRVENTQ